MPMTRVLVVSVCAAALFFAPGCSRPKPVVAPEVPVAPQEETAPEPIPATGGTAQVEPEPTIAPAQVPEAGIEGGELPTDLAELNKAGFLKDAFFDTNKADLRDDARDALAANAAWLKTHPTVRISIEGHCDERNTGEFNLALGWRRANSTKAYLVSLGIGAERISTISYGEEKPFSTCHEERCWSENRRAHVVIVGR
ncbi:MAG: peptidoglycan-associated lipoprotein Pal [Acidobacteriota bacterium]